MTRAYQECLGRPAQPHEVAHWVREARPVRLTTRMICLSDESMRRVPESLYSGPRADHLTSSESTYNIWQNNCHTATNTVIANHPGSAGAVACGGNPERDPGHHTFVYVRQPDGTTKYHNWGAACGPCLGAPPASYAPAASPDACHLECAQRFCDDQFSGETRSLAAGRLVEIPGPSVCYRQATRANGNRDSCTACCDTRAEMWSEFEPTYRAVGQGGESFRRACYHFCRANF